MPNTTATYDSTKVERLKHLLNNYHEKGKAKFYEVFVDKMKVVEKTDDVAEFENYLDFMDDDTEEIKILIYNTGNSPRNDQFTFLLKAKEKEKRMEPKQERALSGIEIENRLEEKLKEERRKWDMDLLKKENNELKEQVQEAEEFIETLQRSVEDLKAKGKSGSIQLGEVVSVLLEGLIRRNTDVIRKLPGGESLAGVIEENNKERGQSLESSPEETQASFKKKEPRERLSNEDEERLEVLKLMQGNFNEAQLKEVWNILKKLSEDSSLISPVLDLLENKK